MTVAAATQRSVSPAAVQPHDDRFVGLAAELGEQFAARAAQHDRDNTFVEENFRALRESHYTALAVPTELGGLGASLRQVCFAQATLARSCASTALAINMHIFLTLVNTYRWKHGAAGAEGLLRRVATDGLLLMSSGASDGLWPTTTATREDGGYRISGTKAFCSEAPVADVLATFARYDDPQDGRVILAVGIPRTSPGFQVIDTWDTLGMRGTASHDVRLDGVFVADAQVSGRRPWGQLDPMLRGALIHFALPVASVYHGIAAFARDEAVHTLTRRTSADGRAMTSDALIQRTIGLIDARLKTAWWALLGALDELGSDFEYALDEQTLNTCMLAKRCVVLEAQAVVDLAMQAVGGGSYFRRSPLERAYRDVRAGSFHPLAADKTLLYAGRLALGQPVDQIL